MKKKIISLCLVVALLAIAITGATLAYFTDKDADVNTMTTGNVTIDQTETDENGDEWEPEEIIPDVPVYKNVHVENTGSQDAYVRTLIAFEDTWDLAAQIRLGFVCPDAEVDDYFTVHTNNVDNWLQFKATVTDAEGNVIDEAIYTVGEYRYLGEEDEIVKAGDTVDSLCQVELKPAATNEWSKYAAGYYQEIGVGNYDVLVLSQAVQTGSFSSADDAFAASFGAIDENSDALVAEWFQAVLAEEYPDCTVVCEAFNYTEYADAIANGETICGLGAPSWMLP